MKFKLTCEVSPNDLKDINTNNAKLTPLYRSNPTSEDIKWINERGKLIVGAACDFIWEMYYRDFIDERILSKKKFFELVREIFGCECKMTRLATDSVKYCFVDKMSSQHKST